MQHERGNLQKIMKKGLTELHVVLTLLQDCTTTLKYFCMVAN